MVLLQELNQIASNRERLIDRWGQLPKHIDFYSEVLYGSNIQKTSSLIVLPYSRPHSNPDWAKLIAISHFRSQFSVIEEIAKILAPAVVEMGVVPVIAPIKENVLEVMSWGSPIVKAISKHGALIYDMGHSI